MTVVNKTALAPTLKVKNAKFWLSSLITLQVAVDPPLKLCGFVNYGGWSKAREKIACVKSGTVLIGCEENTLR